LCSSKADPFQIGAIQDDTRSLRNQIDSIKDLQARLASGADEQRNAQYSRELERLTADTRSRTNDLKKRIKALEGQNSRLGPNAPDTNMRRQQVAAVKSK
jgi:t-SNARE complex subunit (syntaxin)